MGENLRTTRRGSVYRHLRKYDFNAMSDDMTQSTDDDGANQKKRELKWTISYSPVTVIEAEKRLGISMENITAMPVDQMLADAQHGLEQDAILKTKRMVYRQIRQYLQLKGFPSEVRPDSMKPILMI